MIRIRIRPPRLWCCGARRAWAWLSQLVVLDELVDEPVEVLLQLDPRLYQSQSGRSAPLAATGAMSDSDDGSLYGSDDMGDWDTMDGEEHEAAAVLGWTKALWDAGASATAMSRTWDELTDEELQAAEVMGYDDYSWEEGGTWGNPGGSPGGAPQDLEEPEKSPGLDPSWTLFDNRSVRLLAVKPGVEIEEPEPEPEPDTQLSEPDTDEPDDVPLTIILGEHRYDTTQRILTAVPGSFFTPLLERLDMGGCSAQLEEGVKIDRPGELFAHVLSFLESYPLSKVDPSLSLEACAALHAEADFYMLDGLKALMVNRLNPNAALVPSDLANRSVKYPCSIHAMRCTLRTC